MFSGIDLVGPLKVNDRAVQPIYYVAVRYTTPNKYRTQIGCQHLLDLNQKRILSLQISVSSATKAYPMASKLLPSEKKALKRSMKPSRPGEVR